jgi:hypothetical protein
LSWEVLERVGLPVMEDREIYPGLPKVPFATGDTIYKDPGDSITKKEMEDARQDEDAIASLIKSGAIQEKTS